MITSKAYEKLMNSLQKFPNKIQEVATIVASSNVLIIDITKKGELVLKHLEVAND